MSPWFFNIFMDGCIREIKVNLGNINARLKVNGVGWSEVACLFVDDCCLQSARERQTAAGGFHLVCMRRKLMVNV